MPPKRRSSRESRARVTRRRLNIQTNMNIDPVVSHVSTGTMTNEAPMETPGNTDSIIDIHQSSVLPHSNILPATASVAYQPPFVPPMLDNYTSGTVPPISSATYEPPTEYYALPPMTQMGHFATPSHTFGIQQQPPQDQYVPVPLQYPSRPFIQHNEQMGPRPCPSQGYAPEIQNQPVAPSVTQTPGEEEVSGARVVRKCQHKVNERSDDSSRDQSSRCQYGNERQQSNNGRGCNYRGNSNQGNRNYNNADNRGNSRGRSPRRY